MTWWFSNKKNLPLKLAKLSHYRKYPIIVPFCYTNNLHKCLQCKNLDKIYAEKIAI